MAVYTVHEPPVRGSATAAPAPERFVFVRDGFSLAALLFGPLWMLRHRMWLVLLGFAVVVAALATLLHFYGSATADAMAWVLLAFLLAFEAGTLRRLTLARRGYRNIGVVVGDDLEAAERRFFDSWVRGQSGARPDGSAGAPALARSPHPRPAGPDVLGLFPQPGSPP
jgi:hypothetical protein